MSTHGVVYTPTALAGLLSSVMVSLMDAADEEDSFIIIRLFLFAYETITQGSALLQYQGASTRGPYTIRKSNTLEVMLAHENEWWYCQFFWYVGGYILYESYEYLR
jgi:hypothetical protein